MTRLTVAVWLRQHHGFGSSLTSSGSGLLPCCPQTKGGRGIRFAGNRKVVEGIIYRYRVGSLWRDLPREEFGPWQTVWKRPVRYVGDWTWDRVLQTIRADADAAGVIDWNVSVDATIGRAH